MGKGGHGVLSSLHPLARPLTVNCDANTHDDLAGPREAKWAQKGMSWGEEVLAQNRGVQ